MDRGRGRSGGGWRPRGGGAAGGSAGSFPMSSSGGGGMGDSGGYDGKRMRKAIQRKTVDYNSTITRYLEARTWQRDRRDHAGIQPDSSFVLDMLPPFAYSHNPSASITTKFVHTSINKIRCPINVVRWTPEGRRLVTGATSGEFTLWNGLTFNFETILQAHDKAIRSMVWSHNSTWLISGDDSGSIKYWQSNMNNLQAFVGHKESVRDLSFSPTDTRFASCSDDGTIKIWNFAEAKEESTLSGHGWDVKCIDWHPTKGLLASGSKDNLVKLWDPRTGNSLCNLHGHKNTILGIQWNLNGNWLVTASRDQLLRVYDIRTMKELQSFKGHKKEVTSVSWHPFHESLFVSGGSDGSMFFWQTGTEHPVGGMDSAHEGAVFALDWHPLGHILVSGSNDHTTRFWTRNRPGDAIQDHKSQLRKDEEELSVYKAAPSTDTFAGELPGFASRSQGLPGFPQSPAASVDGGRHQMPPSWHPDASIPFPPPPGISSLPNSNALRPPPPPLPPGFPANLPPPTPEMLMAIMMNMKRS